MVASVWWGMFATKYGYESEGPNEFNLTRVSTYVWRCMLAMQSSHESEGPNDFHVPVNGISQNFSKMLHASPFLSEAALRNLHGSSVE